LQTGHQIGDDLELELGDQIGDTIRRDEAVDQRLPEIDSFGKERSRCKVFGRDIKGGQFVSLCEF
jgi:hypothetical protein